MMRSLFLLPLLAAVACSTGATTPGSASSAEIGAAGGSVTLDGATLTIPPNALAVATLVSITASSDATPSDLTAWSPIYELAPAGTTFANPATLSIEPMSGAPSGLMVALSNGDGAYELVPAFVDGGAFAAAVSRISSSFLAGPTSPSATCSAAACGNYTGCSKTCLGANPVPVCTEGKLDAAGACTTPPTCGCSR